MPHQGTVKEFRGLTEEHKELSIEAQRRKLMELRARLTKNPSDKQAQQELTETLEQIGRLQRSS